MWNRLILWLNYLNGFAIRCRTCKRLDYNGFMSESEGVQWWECVTCTRQRLNL